MLPCYNRGCEKDYDPENNPDGEFKISFFFPNRLRNFVVKYQCLTVRKIKIFVFPIISIFSVIFIYLFRLCFECSRRFEIELVIQSICIKSLIIICLFVCYCPSKMHAVFIRDCHFSTMRTKAGHVVIRKVLISPNF